MFFIANEHIVRIRHSIKVGLTQDLQIDQTINSFHFKRIDDERKISTLFCHDQR